MSSQHDDIFIDSPANSQDHTQSTQSQATQDSTFSDYSACLSGTALDRAWGQLDVYQIGEKRFGVRTPIDYSYTKIQSFGMFDFSHFGFVDKRDTKEYEKILLHNDFVFSE